MKKQCLFPLIMCLTPFPAIKPVTRAKSHHTYQSDEPNEKGKHNFSLKELQTLDETDVEEPCKPA